VCDDDEIKATILFSFKEQQQQQRLNVIENLLSSLCECLIKTIYTKSFQLLGLHLINN